MRLLLALCVGIIVGCSKPPATSTTSDLANGEAGRTSSGFFIAVKCLGESEADKVKRAVDGNKPILLYLKGVVLPDGVVFDAYLMSPASVDKVPGSLTSSNQVKVGSGTIGTIEYANKPLGHLFDIREALRELAKREGVRFNYNYIRVGLRGHDQTTGLPVPVVFEGIEIEVD